MPATHFQRVFQNLITSKLDTIVDCTRKEDIFEMYYEGERLVVSLDTSVLRAEFVVENKTSGRCDFEISVTLEGNSAAHMTWYHIVLRDLEVSITSIGEGGIAIYDVVRDEACALLSLEKVFNKVLKLNKEVMQTESFAAALRNVCTSLPIELQMDILERARGTECSVEAAVKAFKCARQLAF